jgi:hypothetical protein
MEIAKMTNAKENIEMMNDLSSKGYETARQLGELNLRTMEMILNRQMDTMNMMMETSLRQMTMLSEAKGYNELVKGQMEIAKEVGERMMEVGRENVKLANERRDEYRTWVEQGVNAVSEKVSSLRQAV